MSRSAVRAVLLRRGQQLDAAEVSYRIYIAVMLTIIVIAPVVRAAFVWLRAELPALPGAGLGAGPAAGEGSLALLAPALTAVTALLVLAGSQLGPARAELPQLDLLFVAPMSRRSLLGGTMARWFGLGALVGAAAAGIVVAARGMRGELEVGLAFALPLAGVGLGLLAVAAPLVGQLGRRVRMLAAALLLALAAAQAVWGGLPDPWSCTARLLIDGAASPRLAVVPVTAAAVAAACASLIASRLRWNDLRERAQRWDTVQTLVVAGDPSAGLARLGAPVRWGRRIRLRPGRSLTGAIIARDLLGIVRTPGRSLIGLGGALLAGACWSAAVGAIDAGAIGSLAAGGSGGTGGPNLLPYIGAALLGAAAMLLAYVSSAAWCRGLAAAAQGSGSPPLLPCSPVGLLTRHLAVPALLAAVALSGGALGWSAFAVNASGEAPFSGPWIPLSALFCAAVTIGMRAVSALKGTIPMRLLAPVPTPAGDMSGVNVLLWTLDGPINSLFIGAGLAIVWAFVIAGGLAPFAAIALSCAVLAGVLLWARVRLGRPMA